MQSFIVLASLIFEMAKGGGVKINPPLVLNVSKNTFAFKGLTLSMPGFQKLAQARVGRNPPPLNSAPLYLN